MSSRRCVVGVDALIHHCLMAAPHTTSAIKMNKKNNDEKVPAAARAHGVVSASKILLTRGGLLGPTWFQKVFQRAFGLLRGNDCE